MHKFSRTQTIIGELCEKLHCSELADDLERVNHAREMLAQLQQNEVFENLQPDIKATPKLHKNGALKLSNLLLETKQRLSSTRTGSTIESRSDEISVHTIEEETVKPEEEYEIESSIECEDLAEDTFLGFFQGYEIVDDHQPRIISENKQCIELDLKDDSCTLENYLRFGIRCFMIDLFVGTELENQKLIFKLCESELKISREYGFPITTTLIAVISPRLQYTGMMDSQNPVKELEKGNVIILSTKRKYTSIGNMNKIYVNARFLLEDCKVGDFILVGPTIQLAVTEVGEEELKCEIKVSGILRSRMPVRFPSRCNRLQISLEELEDITFAREVGINVLVCFKPITQEFLNDFYDALRLLNCNNLRIFTRLLLNEYSEESNELEWIAQRYDGFLLDLSTQQNISCKCETNDAISEIPDMLKLSPNAEQFLTKVYNMKKPILLKPSVIAQRQLFVQPHNISHIYHYPDKYIFSTSEYSQAFLFHLLQNAMSEQILISELSIQKPFCDPSELGEDTIARACVAASLESQAKAIIVCSAIPNMSIYLSHFRPKAIIVQVSDTKSIGDYISLYHHIIFMHFRKMDKITYAEYITNAFIFILILLKSRHILNGGDQVILVYGTKDDGTLCDKYLVYKFDEQHFAKNLEEILMT